MKSTDTLLIVGAGTAGAELAMATRQNGWAGPIVLIGDEAPLPYQRPPLSKAYLSGVATAESLLLRPAGVYAKADVSLRLGVAVGDIDPEGRVVSLSDGTRLAYSRLALCTGGRPRPLSCDGMPADGKPSNLHYLRTRADADAIRASLLPASRLLVVGGGYIGLEVAASARALGAAVTVLEAQPRVLARVTGPDLSAFYEHVHRSAGVDIRTNAIVRGLERDATGKSARAVVCADGTVIEVDVIVVGVGMLPNVELAAAAGLEIDAGIVVDEHAVTSNPSICAAGDCTVHRSAVYGRRIRLESVPNALEQARTAAATLCGKPRAYHPVPWFWSDQYDLKLQMVGLSDGYDGFVLRGAMQTRAFTAFYLRNGAIIAADVVNRPAEFMVAKRLVAARASIDADRLADEAVPLRELLSQAG